jgi:hypothetical protein
MNEMMSDDGWYIPMARVMNKTKISNLKIYGGSYRSGLVLSGTVTLALYWTDQHSMGQGWCGQSRPLTSSYNFGQDEDFGQGQIWRKGENGTYVLEHGFNNWNNIKYYTIIIIFSKYWFKISNDNGSYWRKELCEIKEGIYINKTWNMAIAFNWVHTQIQI